MAFSKKTWKDRQVTNPQTRKITNTETGVSRTATITPAEGKIYNEGTEFNAENMSGTHGLETRIKNAFDTIDALYTPSVIFNRFFPVGIIYTTYTNTNPASILGGGTWVKLTSDIPEGCPLMCGKNMPTSMISGTSLNRNFTANNNNQTIVPQGRMSTNISVEKGYAEVPRHNHEKAVVWQGQRGDRIGHYGTQSCFPEGSYWWQDPTPTIHDGAYTGYTWENNKKTANAGNSQGHTHTFTKGADHLALNSIPINIANPTLTVYCWVRVA